MLILLQSFIEYIRITQLRNNCGLSIRVLYIVESRVADEDESD
jgi:hypothetical protein